MRCSRLLVTGALAVVALFALTASTASAEEKTKMLPESDVSFTTTSGIGKIEEKGAPFLIACDSDMGSGTITAANLGMYKINFAGCKVSIGAVKSCTGIGEATGVILSEGEYHFWLAKEPFSGVVKLVGALAFSPKEMHFTCTVVGIGELVLVKGCFAALTEPLNTLASTTKDVATQTGGVQLITKVLSTQTGESTCELLSSINGAAFAQAGVEGTEENSGFLNAKRESITVLLMNPEAVN